MRWGDVTLAITTAAGNDSTILNVCGSTGIRMKGQNTHLIPGIEWMLVSNVLNEVFEPIVIQWDIFAESLDDLITVEQALLDLFDHETEVSIAGVVMLSAYIDGADIDAPSVDNIYARAIRFEHQPVRSSLQRS